MKYVCTVISVADIEASKQFYQDLFDLKIYQDYGINISFTCGLALQQEFHWLIGMNRESIVDQPHNMELCFEVENFDEFLNKLQKYPHIQFLGDVIEHTWGQHVIRFYDLDGHLIEVGESMKMAVERFLKSGMSMKEISIKMDISIEDLKKLLNCK